MQGLPHSAELLRVVVGGRSLLLEVVDNFLLISGCVGNCCSCWVSVGGLSLGKSSCGDIVVQLYVHLEGLL